MARRAFFSFHYKPDNWRVSTIRNIGAVEGNKPASDNDWETVVSGEDKAIQDWIDDQMKGRGCAVVLIGKETAGRKWIKYEITKAWNDKKGLLGIHIHNIKNKDGDKTTKGANPFTGHTLCEGKKKLSAVVKCYNPPFTDSKEVYAYISDNFEDWIDEAIKIRNDFSCN